jgi:hypothetical protein
MTLTVDYSADWNMVGLPLFVENSNHMILFPESVDGTLYSFSGGYVQENELTAGTGYWLRFSESGMTQITGEPTSGLAVSLNANWNLISGPSFSIVTTAIYDPQNLIIPGTIYEFDGGYVNVDELIPGNGYWLRSSGSGEISFDNFFFRKY